MPGTFYNEKEEKKMTNILENGQGSPMSVAHLFANQTKKTKQENSPALQ
jgi:hypothetical protein